MDQDKIKEILDNHALWLKGAGGSRADMSRANLSGADLSRANLYGADLSRANNAYFPIACPETGSFIAWKKVNGGLIVKLQVLASAKRCSASSRKCRCSAAKVLGIEHKDGSKADVKQVVSNHDPAFVYKIGDTVSVDDFDNDRWAECSTGIHFFITRQEAVGY